MFEHFLARIFKKETRIIPPEEESRGSILSKKLQDKVINLKPKQEVITLLVDRNRWALATLILSGALLVSLVALYQENVRFANHIKVAFVKLDPSGTTNISFYDENSKKPTYFMNTIYSLLSSYVERRYSKINYSINADYGYVLNFMSLQLRNDFLVNYKAAKTAADFIACKTCQQVRVTVRNIQNEESDPVILNGVPETLYRSTVFVRATAFNPDGSEINAINQIVTLNWTIKDISTLPNNRDSLQANPIGIEILSDSLKEDPTPVT